ncbi:MAG: fliF, partial [Polaromonas sp.]|nr:fliF [Polaromonas sp.]
LDRSIRHVQQGAGGIKRLSVAVVVNYRGSVDAQGKRAAKALTATELEQVNNLVKEAMGFSAERGDSLNVVNSAFASDAADAVELPLWKQPENIELAKTGSTYLLLALLALFAWFAVLRPLLRKHLYPPAPLQLEEAEESPLALNSVEQAPSQAQTAAARQAEAKERREQRIVENIQYAHATSAKNPQVVAMLIKQWMAEKDE